MEDPPQGQQHRDLTYMYIKWNESKLGLEWVCLLSFDAYLKNFKKYLLPEVGSTVKLSGEWYKRFWSSQLKIKIGRPTTRSTTPWPHIHVHKMKWKWVRAGMSLSPFLGRISNKFKIKIKINEWKCLRVEKWFVFLPRTHSQVNKQTNPPRHGECYEIKWGVVHNVLVFTIKIKNGRPTPRITTWRPHILSLDAYPMKSNKLLLPEVGIGVKLYGERWESFWSA